MALNSVYLEYIQKAIKENYPVERLNLRMLELGDQIINDTNVKEKTGKKYFSNRNIEHTSVDFNGLNGSLMLDLRKPEEFMEFHNYFDIITNSGTTEHVDPKSKQYECFGILHDCLKIGGIMIHLLPDIDELRKYGAWRYHCSNFYSKKFFEVLAADCKYELKSTTTINHLRCVVLKKTEESIFTKERDKFLSLITYQPIPLFVKIKEKIGELLRTLRIRVSIKC